MLSVSSMPTDKCEADFFKIQKKLAWHQGLSQELQKNKFTNLYEILK